MATTGYGGTGGGLADWRLAPLRPGHGYPLTGKTTVNGGPPGVAVPNSAIIDNYHSWLYKMARVYRSFDLNDHDDLVQEGRVAIWKALDTYDPALGALPSWLTTAAKMRMLEVVKRGNWTGTRGIKGRRREPPAIPVEITDHDRIRSDTPDVDALMDVRAAVAEIPSPYVRRAIFDRFWLDEPVNNGLWYRAKPELRARLAHLRPGI